MKIKSKECEERVDIGTLIEEKNTIYLSKY